MHTFAAFITSDSGCSLAGDSSIVQSLAVFTSEFPAVPVLTINGCFSLWLGGDSDRNSLCCEFGALKVLPFQYVWPYKIWICWIISLLGIPL